MEDANTRHMEAIKKKDEQIRELNSKLSMLQLEVGQSDYLTKKSSERNQEKSHELQVCVEINQSNLTAIPKSTNHKLSNQITFFFKPTNHKS